LLRASLGSVLFAHSAPSSTRSPSLSSASGSVGDANAPHPVPASSSLSVRPSLSSSASHASPCASEFARVTSSYAFTGGRSM